DRQRSARGDQAARQRSEAVARAARQHRLQHQVAPIMSERFFTHEVENQPPPLAPYDAWKTDLALQEALKREGGAWAIDQVARAGPLAGGELMAGGFEANENKPKLK